MGIVEQRSVSPYVVRRARRSLCFAFVCRYCYVSAYCVIMIIATFSFCLISCCIYIVQTKRKGERKEPAGRLFLISSPPSSDPSPLPPAAMPDHAPHLLALLLLAAAVPLLALEPEAIMRRALSLAQSQPRAPFGAVIVNATDGRVLAEGVNAAGNDPTKHGEVRWRGAGRGEGLGEREGRGRRRGSERKRSEEKDLEMGHGGEGKRWRRRR